MKRNRPFFFLFLLILSVCVSTAAPRSAYAEETPSGDNTDGGSISLDIVHYQAQSLTLRLNSDHLAYQDVTLNCEDPATGKPITISLLASPGTSEYTLYDLETPVEELTGTLNISMITEPGYQLDPDNTFFTVNGQTYGNGSVVTIHTPSTSVNSSISCREQEAASPETSGETESPAQPQDPETSGTTGGTETPAQPQDAETSGETSVQPDPAAEPQTSAETGTPAQSEVSAQAAPSGDAQTSTPSESTSAGIRTAADTAVLQTEPVETAVPEVLTTTPITEDAAATDAGTAAATPGSASVNTAAGSTVAQADTPPVTADPESAADPILSSSARTTEENTGLYTSDIVRIINLVLAVLMPIVIISIIFMILILTKRPLTLKRGTKKHRYPHAS